jgi:radical SAM protein with 4Fe4S-binding SPASM domain
MNNLTLERKRPLLHDVMARCAERHVPLQVALELTYRCNLHCTHCYIDIAEEDEMSFTDWCVVLDQLKTAGTLYLLLTGGEILVRRDFLDIATYARRNGFFLALLTNCTLITPDLARAISGLKPFVLGTSLYGATVHSHELVTRVPGSFKKTLAGVQYLVNAGLRPTVQVTATKDNVNEFLQIKELVESLGAWARFKAGMTPSKTGDVFPFQLEPDIKALNDYGWQISMTQPECDSQPGLCAAGRGICSISPRGDVFPCVMFPMKLGNLRQSNFNSIWRLEPCDELRYLRSMRRSDLIACSACEIKAYCYRCTGTAYLESGRMDGPSPTACRHARALAMQ